MSEVTRRDFVGMAALAGGLAVAPPGLAQVRSKTAVDFTVDGIPRTVSPPETGAFWVKVNETLRGASSEALAEAFRSALG